MYIQRAVHGTAILAQEPAPKQVEKRSVNSLGLVGSWTCVLDPLRAVRECHHCMPPPGEGMTPPYGHTEGNRITREVENISASGVFQKVFRNI